MASDGAPCVFRVTGPQSIERLEPLVPQVVPGAVSICSQEGQSGAKLEASGAERLDFVWETACEMTWRARHSEATVLNKLHNVVILEDKANLAFLQLRMNCPVIDTFIASCAEDVGGWAKRKWSSTCASSSPSSSSSSSGSKNGKVYDENDWWVVKASAGNGGKDIWVMTCDNYGEVLSELPSGETFVMQRYVARPMLWKGKKFHFRCYSVLRADMTALLYQMAYILTAGYDYANNESMDTMMDSRRLITNLSVNKAIEGHPGQMPCNLKQEYPHLFKGIASLWKEVAKACSSFMKYQTSPHHFEFFGIDVIADESGICWLLEVNRLPGLEASAQNKKDEDAMYDSMMLSLLRIVLVPLRKGQDDDCSGDSALWETVHDVQVGQMQGEEEEDGIAPFNSKAPCWKNTFSWRAFTRKKHNRSLVVVSATEAGAETTRSSGNDDRQSAEVKGIEDTKTGPEGTGQKCGVLGCIATAKLRCSKCKTQHYCSAEHQRTDWASHRRSCRTAKEREKEKIRPPQPPENEESGGDGSRQSRCFFCGENIVMKDEYDAQLHMQECPALQEQLASKDQFTIPKALRDRGVTLQDVHRQHEQDQEAGGK